MKTIFSLVGILFLTSINAQKFDCSSKTTAYQDAFKLKDITAAFDTWSEVRKNCPNQSETVYTDGVNILQYKIDNAANPEEKEALVRDLLKLYDQYHKNFPTTTADFEVSKAMALFDNKIESNDEILSLLDSGFLKASESVSNAKAIFTYFSLCYDKYKAGDKKFTADVVIEKYALVNTRLTALISSNSGKENDFRTAQRNINALAKDLVTCDNLAIYYEKYYPQNKDNAAWVTNALSNLSGKCSAKPIFDTMAQNLYAVKVTSQSSYFMALATLKQRKFEESIKFYNQSAELETNPTEKAKTYYTLATGLLANDLAKSKEALNKALQFDPKMGRAYLYLAEIYGNAAASDCAKTEKEKKAIYYLAAQTAKKVEVADPRLKAAGDKMAQEFNQKAMSQSEITKEKLNGKSLTIGCWINETITFPAK